MEKGLKIQSDVGVHYDFGFFYGLLGTVHLESGDLIKAQHLTEEALKIAQKNHEKPGEGFAWILLGRILGESEKSQYDRAEECILQGIKIFEELKQRPSYAQGYLFLGGLYADVGQPDKALENWKKAEGMFREMGMRYWLARTYGLYAGLFKKEGELSKAKDTLAKAIEILKECGADGWVEKYEKELATLS